MDYPRFVILFRVFLVDIPTRYGTVQGGFGFLPPAKVPESLSFKVQLDRSFLMDNVPQAPLVGVFSRIRRISVPGFPDTCQARPRPDQVQVLEYFVRRSAHFVERFGI